MADPNGSHVSLVDFIGKNAEDLWGDFKHTDFGKVILPFTLLRGLECVLEPTRKEVREAYLLHKDTDLDLDLILRQVALYPFYNTSEYTLGGTKTNQNLQNYVAQFSDNARIVFEQFDFTNTITRLDKVGLLFKICSNFAGIDLHPSVVPDLAMSNLYEHLIRRFGAEVNEAAEDFMTPCIRVLRPLRMALHVHAESLARLKADKAWAKLTTAQQAAWESALQPHLGTTQPLSWAESFAGDTASMPAVGKATKAVVKALVNALGERDPESEPVVDADGQPITDPALTDYENVSLIENVGNYFAREVLPHVPDAWIDETYRDPQDGGVGRVGYEINFNRYFYQYIPPRPLEAIDADLQWI